MYYKKIIKEKLVRRSMIARIARFMATIVVVTLILSSFCFTATAEQEKELYIMVAYLTNISFWLDPVAGAESMAKEMGVELQFVGPDRYDSAGFVTALEQAIVRRPAGIIVCPVDEESAVAPIQKALDRKIPVVTVDTDSSNSGRLCFLGTGRYASGWSSAKIIHETLGNNLKLLFMTIAGHPGCEQQIMGFKDYIKENNLKWKITATGDSLGEADRATTVAAQLIQANPDVDAIVGFDTVSGPGAARAVVQAGKKDKIFILSQQGNPRDREIIEYVNEGWVDIAFLQRAWTMGYYALKMLYDVNHNNTNFGMSWEESGINPLPEKVNTGTMVITRENAGYFLKLLDEAGL